MSEPVEVKSEMTIYFLMRDFTFLTIAFAEISSFSKGEFAATRVSFLTKLFYFSDD